MYIYRENYTYKKLKEAVEIHKKQTRNLSVLSKIYKVYHCVKSVQIRSFFWSVFSRLRAEYGQRRRISPYSVQMQENANQKKLRIWTLFTQCILYVLLNVILLEKFSFLY